MRQCCDYVLIDRATFCAATRFVFCGDPTQVFRVRLGNCERMEYRFDLVSSALIMFITGCQNRRNSLRRSFVLKSYSTDEFEARWSILARILSATTGVWSAFLKCFVMPPLYLCSAIAEAELQQGHKSPPAPASGPYMSLEDLDRLTAAGGGVFRVKAVVSDTMGCKIRKKKYLVSWHLSLRRVALDEQGYSNDAMHWWLDEVAFVCSGTHSNDASVCGKQLRARGTFRF